jgi:hypothetical protein
MSLTSLHWNAPKPLLGDDADTFLHLDLAALDLPILPTGVNSQNEPLAVAAETYLKPNAFLFADQILGPSETAS